MSRLRTLVAFSVCGALTANGAIAGGPFSFSNPNKLSDTFMVMTVAYALGLSSTEDNFDGAIELATSIAGAQIITEGIKGLELERRPNGSDWKSFPSGHSAAAFSSAMFVHRRYGWKPAIIPYCNGRGNWLGPGKGRRALLARRPGRGGGICAFYMAGCG